MWYGERDEHDPRFSVDNPNKYSPAEEKYAKLGRELSSLNFSLMKCLEVGDKASAEAWQKRIKIKEDEINSATLF